MFPSKGFSTIGTLALAARALIALMTDKKYRQGLDLQIAQLRDQLYSTHFPHSLVDHEAVAGRKLP